MIPKFKVWDKHNEQMIEWVDLDFSKDSGEDDITVFEPTGIVRSSLLMPILLQSTGLFDKNGTEIFEGDILIKSNKVLGIVKFGRYTDDEYITHGLDGWLVSLKGKYGGYDIPLTEWILERNYNVKIVGSKFQNKDLLEEE